MSLLDLFAPPPVKPAAGRMVRLAGVMVTAEEKQSQWLRALEKGRATLAAKERTPRPRMTREQINAARRAQYARDRAAGVPRPQSKATPYMALPEHEKERRREQQRAYYQAHRAEEAARAQAKYAALPAEERKRRQALANEWKRNNRERVNARARQLRAERAAAQRGSPE